MIVLKAEDYPDCMSQISPELRTPRALVLVHGNTPGFSDYEYEMPSGMQPEKYIYKLFHNYDFCISGINRNSENDYCLSGIYNSSEMVGFRVEIFDGKGDIIQTHVGLYIREEV
jgi:hypothetical protein